MQFYYDFMFTKQAILVLFIAAADTTG